MPEQKYISHSDEDCTGKHTNRAIKDVLRGYMGSRADTVKQYHKYEKKWKKELKALKKKNMLFSIANKFGLFCEFKKIKNIRTASKKRCESIINSSSDKSD